LERSKTQGSLVTWPEAVLPSLLVSHWSNARRRKSHRAISCWPLD